MKIAHDFRVYFEARKRRQPKLPPSVMWSKLEGQPHRKLNLPRAVCEVRVGVLWCTGSGVIGQRIDSTDRTERISSRADRSHVLLVGQVEGFADELGVVLLAKGEGLLSWQIDRG